MTFDPARVDLAKQRLALYLAGKMDDPGYEPENLLVFDVWCLEKEDFDWLRTEVIQALNWRGADRKLGRQIHGLMKDEAARNELGLALDSQEKAPDDRMAPPVTFEGETERLRATVVFLARVTRIDLVSSARSGGDLSVRLALLESFVPAAGAAMPSESVLTLAWASDRPPAGDESADRRLRFGAEVIVFSEGFTGAARSMLVPPPSLMAQVRRAMELVEGIDPVHRKMMSNRGYEVTDARLDEQRRLYKRMLKYLGQRHAPSAGSG